MRPLRTIEALVAHRALRVLPTIWLDLAHGQVSPEHAARVARETEPEALVKHSLLLFAPPSSESDERLLALIATHDHASVHVLERRQWIYGGLAAVAAVAAVFLLLMVSRIGHEAPPPFDEGYALILNPEHQHRPVHEFRDRSDPPPSRAHVVYPEHGTVEILLRPETDVSTAINVEIFATTAERNFALSFEPEINEHGVIKIVATTDELGLSVGRWSLTAIVGPPEHLPTTLETVPIGDVDAPYQILSFEIEIIASTDPPSP